MAGIGDSDVIRELEYSGMMPYDVREELDDTDRAELDGDAFPPLPELDPPTNGESLQGYALRVLTFVMTTGVTATLPDEALRLADHCYPVAVSNHEILAVAVDRMSAARRQILAALADRESSDSHNAAPVVAPVSPSPSSDPSSKVPVHPSPFNRPPSGQKVQIEF